MTFIIDGHAHIFPNKIAMRASKHIGEFYHLPMRYDGTVNTLLKLGDTYGIDRFMVQSVATVPEQVAQINNFLARVVAANSQRLIGFATLHPDMEDPAAELRRVLNMGLLGVKLHPDFQDFNIDDKKVYPIYAACENVCPILLHTGDLRFSRSCPSRVTHVLPDFPKLKLICAHFGGWTEWAEAEGVLTAHHDNIWVDTSSSLYALHPREARRLIELYGADRVIFGTDYPMWNAGEELAYIRALELDETTREQIFWRNLYDLLHLAPTQIC